MDVGAAMTVAAVMALGCFVIVVYEDMDEIQPNTTCFGA
jgi:hypothetical protein